MDDSDFVLVRFAAEKTGYTAHHIRRLIHTKVVLSKDIGILLVHLPSLLEYKAEMDAQGSKKFSPSKKPPSSS